MYQSFDSWLEFHERAEIRHTCDCTSRAIARFVFVRRKRPWVGLKLLHPKRNAPPALSAALLLDFQNLHVNRIARFQQVGRLVDAAPGHVGYVQQAVDAADV